MGNINIRCAAENDFDSLMELYTHLHENRIPEKNAKLEKLWTDIINDKNYYIVIAAETNGKIVSSCVLIIVPNLTHNQRPYAFIENVVTDKDYRSMGYATACLNFAKDIAVNESCYKIMLMTGAKEKSTLDFYRHAGYNSEDKTAFIQWL